MQLCRVRLRNTWITPGGQRFRKGEAYIPYDLYRLLPKSAVGLPDDDFIRKHDYDQIVKGLENSIEYCSERAKDGSADYYTKLGQEARDTLAGYKEKHDGRA